MKREHPNQNQHPSNHHPCADPSMDASSSGNGAGGFVSGGGMDDLLAIFGYKGVVGGLLGQGTRRCDLCQWLTMGRERRKRKKRRKEEEEDGEESEEEEEEGEKGR